MQSKSQLTQDKLKAHSAKAMLVTCMDFRFHNDAAKYMKDHGYDVNYDKFVLAGVSLGMNQTQKPYWAEALMDHIEMSKTLHHITKVILMDHLDCGAYKTFRPDVKTEEEEIEAHKENLKKAEERIKKRFPEMKIKKRLMHKDGSVEKI